ncbi:MAG TPA: hypothetical protein VEY12_07735 [Thermoplasmata archaeon]|nr:hypothetical protein [Thermoplasmata archaeon]
MSEKRDLAIVGLLLGLLGGALILAAGLDLGRLTNLTIDFVLSRLVDLVLGIAVLFGSLLLYRGRYSTGGILNLILGIVALIIGTSQVGGILVLISGVVGLVANEARS